MLASSNHLPHRPIPLQARNQRLHIPFNPEGIFPGRLGPPPPSRIFVGVDIRCPVIQPAKPEVGKCPGFGADGCADFVHKLVVKGGAQVDGVGEGGGVGEGVAGGVEVDAWGAGDAVEAFGPPIIGWEAEARSAFASAVWVKVSFSVKM